MTDVLDAQSALLQSETNYARALADFHIATAKLRLATGGDPL
jgi:outer membrane protein TolC